MEKQVDIVKKSNALARASWSVKSVYEPRLIALVAARVGPDDKDFQTYEIPVKELLGESQDGRSYQLVADVVDNIFGRAITIPKENGWTKYAVFSKCEYDNVRGCIIARFDPDLKEHFLGLKSHFTKYSLVEFMTLPSIYSQRLFEILKSWSDKHQVVLDLQDLYKILQAPKSMQRYPDFRRYVLEKAHRDINSKTSFRYEWEPIKNGRAYAAIKFIFSLKQRKSFENNNVDKQCKANNKMFIAAIKCLEDGNCNYKESSKKCQVCRRIHNS